MTVQTCEYAAMLMSTCNCANFQMYKGTAVQMYKYVNELYDAELPSILTGRQQI